MIHLKVTCDIRRKKKDGSHPIVFRITLNGKTRDIATGYSCSTDVWDSKNNSIIPVNEKLESLGKRIKDQELIFLEKIRDYEMKYPNSDNVQEVKDFLANNRVKSVIVFDLWQEEIQRLKKAKRFGNARNYESALLGIEKYTSLRIPFNKIDYRWLEKLETDLRAQGLKTNSIAVYMRTLRSIFNKAINYELTDANSYPFRRYKIRSDSTPPRVANIEELQRYFALDLDQKSHLYDYWNYGRLIFLLRGINYADLALLTRDNVKHGRLVYKRSKTHKMYSVELLPLALEIFKLYMLDDRETLLPILTGKEYENKSILPARISQQRKTCNKWLKKIGKQLDIVEPLSTYVFRYSHANACKNLGYSKDLISESLGHGYGLAVSSAYLENFNVELIDEMNRSVCNKIMGV